jgi:hypothetical protein
MKLRKKFILIKGKRKHNFTKKIKKKWNKSISKLNLEKLRKININ